MTDSIGSDIQSQFICPTAEADADYSYVDALCSCGSKGESGAIKIGDTVPFHPDNGLTTHFFIPELEKRNAKVYFTDFFFKTKSVEPLDDKVIFDFPKLFLEVERRYNFKALKEAGIIKKGDSLARINAKLDEVSAFDYDDVLGAMSQTRVAKGTFFDFEEKKIDYVAGANDYRYPYYVFLWEERGYKVDLYHELTHLVVDYAAKRPNKLLYTSFAAAGEEEKPYIIEQFVKQTDIAKKYPPVNPF